MEKEIINSDRGFILEHPICEIWKAANSSTPERAEELHKLDMKKICEQIRNEAVAKKISLSLSGILTIGIVRIYERKLKLINDDVHRLLSEIDKARKGKSTDDPRVLLEQSVEADNIFSLNDDNGSYIAETEFYDGGERIQIDRNEENQINTTPEEQHTLAPSATHKDVQLPQVLATWDVVTVEHKDKQ